MPPDVRKGFAFPFDIPWSLREPIKGPLPVRRSLTAHQTAKPQGTFIEELRARGDNDSETLACAT